MYLSCKSRAKANMWSELKLFFKITIALNTDVSNVKQRLVEILNNIIIIETRNVHFYACCLQYGFKIDL